MRTFGLAWDIKLPKLKEAELPAAARLTLPGENVLKTKGAEWPLFCCLITRSSLRVNHVPDACLTPEWAGRLKRWAGSRLRG